MTIPPRLVSIVVPVYDSSVLIELTDRIESALAGQGVSYEIIFVDDGSSEPGVWPTLSRLAAERPAVRAIQLTRNFGQQAATLCGLAEAGGDVVVTLDDDLQHDPADLPRLLGRPDADIVIGQLLGKRHPPLRRAASRVKGLFDRMLIGRPVDIQLSSYRVLSRAVVDGVLAAHPPRPFLPALMFHASRNVVGVPVAHHPRLQGRSGYTWTKMFRVFSNLLINNSALLLRLVGFAGLSCAGASFVMSAIVVYRRLAHSLAVPGWASLMVAQLLIGGLVLVALAVVGEYLLRIVEAAEGRPAFLVRRRAGGAPAGAGQAVAR